MLIAADTQAPIFQSFGDFNDLSVLCRTEIANNRIGFVDFNSCPNLERIQFDIRVDIGVEVIVAHRDIRRAIFIRRKEHCDTVCGCGQLVVSFVVFRDQLLGFGELLFVGLQLMPEQEKILIIGIDRVGAFQDFVQHKKRLNICFLIARDRLALPVSAALAASPAASIFVALVTFARHAFFPLILLIPHYSLRYAPSQFSYW